MIPASLAADERFGNVSRGARLTFLLMGVHCDDAGVHPAQPKLLRAELFPYDDLGADVIQSEIEELKAAGLVLEYAAADGRRYWSIRDWLKFQRIEKPRYTFPTPPGLEDGSPTTPPLQAEASATSRRLVADSSAQEVEVEVEEEMEGEKETNPPAPAGAGAADADASSASPLSPSDARRTKRESKADRLNRLRGARGTINGLNEDTWDQWVAHRGAKLTPQAAGQQGRKLREFAAAGHDVNVILETSIANCWAGLFEPKVDSARAGKPSATAATVDSLKQWAQSR